MSDTSKPDDPSLAVSSRNTQVGLPIPRARNGLRLIGTKRSKATTLLFPEYGDGLLIFAGSPIAVQTGGMAYFNCKPGVERSAVNAWVAESVPLVNASADQFDFLVGQVLQRAGLMLTTRRD